MADEEEMTPEQAAQYQKENCLFCKILSGDIPSKKVYEDNDFVGILDINPATEGHVLLLPKQHFQIMPQMPQELVGNLGPACAQISAKIINAFKCDGTSIFAANGAVAGQRAPHFMIHIMPRKEGDGISLNPKLADIDDRLFGTVHERLVSSTTGRHPSPKVQKEISKDEKRSKENPKELEPYEEVQNSAEQEIHEDDNNTEDDTSEMDEEAEGNIQTKSKEKGAEANISRNIPANRNEKQNANAPSKKSVDFDKLSRLFQK